jgi:hypothetical protein
MVIHAAVTVHTQLLCTHIHVTQAEINPESYNLKYLISNCISSYASKVYVLSL